ncbi:patatin-like phospholipase family protein [Terricaulis sp.]|uniref:patatin-like phospholipase family protein n=1 Tax=Terricaulis sp. TaxID=2768686 RepID=UPI002AC6BBB3|nr:patatin-like phospholipase family protein [Terricaulis sp.]MDZ4691278.1 patatin-like phospholipase family protein [Terricaulis sp.]
MKKKPISLALQGGGALGAYTWGALDRLLEDERLEIKAVSGSSAGAMCAVVLADGLHDGPEAARAKLRQFWEGVAQAGRSNPYRRTPLMAFLSAFQPAWLQQNYAALWAGMTSQVASPYDLNPLNLNPLREMLEELVDFERVRACSQLQLFIGATNVETGRIRIFRTDELTADHVMASACLPQLFHAVEIDGVPYWDGGFTGNPALFPLFDVQETSDIVIVQIHPIERVGTPRTAADISARETEITFNASLLGELRAIDFVARLMDQQKLPEGRYRKMLIHNLSEGTALTPLGSGIDLNTDLNFFNQLFEIGWSAADAWLGSHFDAIGKRSTVDLAAMFRRAPEGGEPLR